MNKYALIDSDYTDNSCNGCDCCPNWEQYWVERIFESEKELSEHFAQNGYVLLELTEDPELKKDLEHVNEDTDMNQLDGLCEAVFKGQDPAPRPTKYLSAKLIKDETQKLVEILMF